MPKKETLIIILLCFISRLPQLLSNNLILDGDECVVALMAKHLYEGKEFPLYFYGQSYGFSLIELFSINIHYFLFGISDVSVKLSMLLIWTIGVIFFYKTLVQFNFKNSYIPFIITLVLIFAPTWAVWSMKARGGYLSSFLICSVITYLLFNDKLNKKIWIYALTGILLIIMYETQPLWLPGLLPILIYKLYSSGRKKFTISFFTGAFITMGFFYFIKKDIPQIWHPHVFEFSSGIWTSLLEMPYRIFLYLSGSYYLVYPIHLNFITELWAISFTALLFIIPAVALIYLLKKKKTELLFFTLFLSVVFSVSYILFIPEYSARYLLPLIAYSLMMFAFLADKINLKASFNVVAVFFIALGAVSVFTFKDFKFKTYSKENVTHLVDAFLSRDIHHVFCANPLLQWQIMYYSKERIVARYAAYAERYPEYIRQVNNAFLSKDKKVAITGTFSQKSPFWKEFISVDDQFFINEDPSYFLLLNYGFELDQHMHKP
jgi:hypothetical protein